MLPLVVGCTNASKTSIMQTPLVVPSEVVELECGTQIYFGGYGSSMAFAALDSSFYLLTDRGANIDGHTSESKRFLSPDFVPTIGRFKLQGDSLVLVEKILLKQSDGTPFLGLPNREGDGVTGEVAYDINNNIITSSYRGIDSEGLALSADGSFWVSDEYAPFVMHFGVDGVLIKEYSPSNGLPEYFAKRRPNRGMEGLTINSDGTKLYGIMQSPLYLPDNSTKDNSVNNRILELDIQSGVTREFIYRLESAQNVVSEICFLTDSTMLVLERDGKFPKNGKGFKRVYEVNIAGASDVSGSVIEVKSLGRLNSQGIRPVGKRLAVDILREIPTYRHDKAEGIALINENTLAVVNDDDFSVIETPDGGVEPKFDRNGVLDRSTIYFMQLNNY